MKRRRTNLSCPNLGCTTRPARLQACLAALLLCLSLSGCAGFFTAGTTTTTAAGAASTGDYVYTVDSASNQLNGFSVGTGTLTTIAGLPANLTTGLSGQSVTVSRPNSFVFVGGSGAITCYSLGTAGALSAQTAGGGTATATFVSLETSPDGKWLLALDAQTLTVYVYAINTSTCALTLNSTAAYGAPSTQTVNQRQVRISPSGNVVAIALGTAGDVVFAFNTGTGALTFAQNIFAPGYSDNALTFDANSAFLYVARATIGVGASGVASYSVTSGGAVGTVQTLAISGSGPFSLAFDGTNAYLYAANRGDSTLTGYSIASGTLTALATSPYASNTTTTALVRDNSGKYIVALGTSGSSDVTLFGQDAVTPGKLDALVSVSTGSAGAVASAATHTSAGL